LDIAQAGPEIITGGLCRILAVESHAHECLRTEPGQQCMSMPLGKHLARVKREIAWRDHWRPVDRWRYQVRPGRVVRDRSAVIVAAARNDRPAVIVSRLHQIEFVAASRPMLQVPQFTEGIDMHAQYVAVAV